MAYIIVHADEPRLVDYGTAPHVIAAGLARVDIMGGITRFAFFELKNTLIDGCADHFREVTSYLSFPTEAVAPALELIIATFGPRLLLPANSVMRRLLM